REAHDEHIGGADIVVRMPDEARDVHELATMFRKDDAAYLAAGRRVRPRIEQHERHLPREDRVAVLVLLVQAPTLHEARPNGERVREDQRVRVEAPAEIVELGDASPLVGKGRKIADSNTM